LLENQPENLGSFVIVLLIIWIVLIIFSIKWQGLKKTVRFFIPVIIGGFALEVSGVLSGKYIYSGYVVFLMIRGYEIPLIIILGWSGNLFLLYHMARFMVMSLVKKENWIQMVLIACCTGLFGICLDLLEDPIAHHNRWWVWQEGLSRFDVCGVPFLNFLAWFVFLFYLSLAFMIVDRTDFSENQKLVISIVSLPLVGFLMLITQIGLRTVF